MSYASIVERWVALCARRGPIVLALALASAAVSFVSASRLDVDASLAALLPEDTVSARSLAELRERTAGQATPLYFVVRSDDIEVNRAIAARLAREVQSWPETRWAIDRRDPSYLLDRRLLYLPTEGLEDIADRVEILVDWEECEAIPGCVPLEARPDPPTAAEIAALYEGVPQVDVIRRLFGLDALPTGEGDEDVDESHLGELCAADGDICAVQVVLEGSSSNLAFATEILARSEALFASIDAGPGVELFVVGTYRNVPLIRRAAVEDLQKTAALGGLLVLLLLFGQFRRLRSLPVLLLPITVGAAWTGGVLGAVHPELNLISSFTLAILFGLGIDFGIHMWTRYGDERNAGAEAQEAVARTLTHLGASMLGAALTTGCGFAALAASRFRGIAELGALAALGVGLTLVATWLLFPAVVLTANRWRPLSGSPLRFPIREPRALGRGVSAAIVAVGLVLGVGGGAVAWDGLEFEHDFKRLQPEVVTHNLGWSRAVPATTKASVFMMADAPAPLAAAAADLSSQRLEDIAPDGPLVVTASSFVPEDQERRLAAVRLMRESVERAERHDSLPEQVTRWRPLLEADGPIRVEELPRWALELFTDREGGLDTLGIAYFTSLSGGDAHDMERLSIRMNQWRQAHPEVRFASPVALLGEIVPQLREDAPRMLGLALLGLLVGTLLIGRSLRRTLLITAPILLAAGVSAGAMAVLGMRVNLYNLLVFPIAFGMGVDGAIYLVWGEGEAALRSSAGRAVMGSTLTTIAAFGSLSIASNVGIASLGQLAVLTLGATLLANLVWLPALLRLMPSKATKTE